MIVVPPQYGQGMIRDLVQDLVGVVFPGVCPGCGAPAEPICGRCAVALRPAPPAPPPSGVDAWFAPFAYDGVARELIARVKYHGRHASLAWLAAEMVAAYDIAVIPVDSPKIDVVTWVPTDAVRRRARGFDHAQRLALLVGARLGAPVRSLLVRGPGPPQTQRSIEERRAGPSIRSVRKPPRAVLVVDDVSTTGASLRAAAHALRAAGARHVVALTAARTPANRRANNPGVWSPPKYLDP